MKINLKVTLWQVIRGVLFVMLFHAVAWAIMGTISVIAMRVAGYTGLILLLSLLRGFSYWQLVYVLPFFIMAIKKRNFAIAFGIVICAVTFAPAFLLLYPPIDPSI